jgi:hypothetical protein
VIVPGRALALALALALAGCGGATGTFTVELVTAPGSTVLDDVTRARLTLSLPYRQVEATRDADGKFHLSIDVPAEGPTGQLMFEGLDDAGAVIAWGRSGLLPIAAVDASIAIYVAAPQTLAAAPVPLDPPRRDLGIGRFGFGLLLVGGADGAGAPLDTVQIYDVYSHQLVDGEDAPGARAGPAVGAGITGYAYVFGGRGPEGTTGSYWRFDTTVAPAGQWLPISTQPLLSRGEVVAAPLRTEAFVVTGDPPVVMDGLSLSATALASAPALAGTATAVQLNDALYVMAVGDGSGSDGLVRFAPGSVDEYSGVASARRTGHGAVGTRTPSVVVLGGAVGGVPTDVTLVARPVQALFDEIPGLLATPRVGAAVGGNNDVAIVAGGRDAGGTLLADAEIIDLLSLTRLGSTPMVVPRTGAQAVSLVTGQILVIGGVDDAGAPVGTIEIFTPAAPEPP